MKNMRVLYHNGRVVAINKDGKWETMEGVTSGELGSAIHAGDIEYFTSSHEVTNSDMVDFILTMAVCLTLLFGGIFLFNIQ